MASRVTAAPGAPRLSTIRRSRRAAFEVLISLAVCAIFLFKLFSYLDPAALTPSTIVRTYTQVVHNTASFISNLPILNNCPSGLVMKGVPGGYVCVRASATGIYSEIYGSYPLVGSGREAIYASTDQGSISAADDLMRNQYDIPRYAPVRLSSTPTWSEDPYSADYWRFEFYSLHPSLSLLYAFRTTGNDAYARKLVSVDLSFIAAEDHSRWAWSDPHAVAFRSMALVDTWWKLRQAHQLSEAASGAILAELEKTGQFLADPNHYQAQGNHCVNEAAALYELAAAFPTLPNAKEWLALSKQRFQWQLGQLIDSDGEEIENSPYYDFYAMTKYIQIYDYSRAHNSLIADNFGSKLAAMTRFASYILEPDSQVPLLGASIEATINYHGVYLQLAAKDPHLLYVLTHGAKGTVPGPPSMYFGASGLTVMRSGWQSGPDFTNSTYLTYYIGRYRTSHSDLGALGITLYGDGGDLLPGAGLYTYQPGAYRDYFHGTSSENTVVVDCKSQVQGDGTGTPLVTTDGMTYQSAESSLYDGVTHQRLVVMIDKDHLLVIDHLRSASVHLYQQMFHLFPGAKLSESGLTVTGTGGTPRRQLTIQQLQPGGITETAVINQRGSKPAGLCSEQYGKLLPCYQISYSQHGRDAGFATLITIGKSTEPGFSVTVADGGQRLDIADGLRHISMNLGASAGKPMQARATDHTPPPTRVQSVPASSAPADWTATGDGVLHFGHALDDDNHLVARLSTSSSSPAYMKNDAIRLNLLQNNARIRLKVDGYSRLSDLDLIFSNDHGAKTVTKNLLDAYGRTQNGDWEDVFLGPSASWGARGGWTASSPGFNWAAIDGMEIKIAKRAGGGLPTTISIDSLSLLPQQKEANLVFIFDDGYQSILPAASYLHENGMAANAAVIGKYVDVPGEHYLNPYQLKALQNNWGWDIVNHTQQHADAVASYYDRNDMTGYENDILQQAAWLEANGLNSAPNWFVYPHGSTNAELESVVGQYYMFARITTDNPEAYPYGNPLAITDLEVHYPGDGGDTGTAGLTTPAEMLSAVHQAIKYHMTLILTFHRIHSEASDVPGYPLALFKQVVNGVKESGIKVLTLSQLDESNGIPVNNHIYYHPAQPPQITVHVEASSSARPEGLWARVRWLVVIFVFLLFIIVLVLAWRTSGGGAPTTGNTSAAHDSCLPGAVGAPAHVSDRYDRQVLSLHPVLYLTLGESSSALEPDLSGNGYNGIYMPYTQRPDVARLPNGDPAAVFNGIGQYVQVPSARQLSIVNTGCLTVEAWIRPDVLQFPHDEGTGYVNILGKGTEGKQEYAFRMYSSDNSENPPRPNRISGYVFNLAGGLGSGAYFQDKIQPGEWIMVTFLVDSRPSPEWPHGYVAIYKDGRRRGNQVSLSQFHVTPEASNAPFRIATRDLQSFFEGAIGKVAVYDTILSDQEILATYEAMVSG